ncbi:protein kinase domain-containing protein [Nocardioides allogilvus]|nr:protein kinase [Nocardioides allogilvus]
MSIPEHGSFADDAHRYALVSRLATGGMGEVWRGRDTTLDRPVAIKLLKAEYADDATFRRRFEGEAQHAASLHHPGIAGVFDFGEASPLDGSATPRPYLVMELVEGQPLSALLRPGAPMDVEVTRDLMTQTADALGAAHRAGIVHRDIKPGNLIVTPDRQIKVTDFGIARAADGMAITETGQVMGTPAYLSPEQAEGRSATAASDVYSLGCVAFECLAGRRPFTAETSVATAVAHVRQPVPALPSSVPADLAAVVTRALAKDPAARYADGSAFAAALRSPTSAAAAAVPAVPAGGAAATVPPPGTVAEPPPETTVLPATPVAAPAQRRTNVVPWFLLGAVLVAAALIIWQILGGADDTDDQPDNRRSPSQTRTQTEPPSATPETQEPTVASIEVDESDYIGREIGEVQSALKDLGLQVTREKLENPGGEVEGTVAGVNPSGTLVEGDRVTVTYWGKAPKEPEESPSEEPTPVPTEVPTETLTETPTETTAPTETSSQ